MIPNPVIHFEIMGKDGAKLQQFYSSAFGWSIDADSEHGTVDSEGDGIGGGISGDENGARVTVYISVEDLKASLEEVKAAGGAVVMEPQAIPDGPEIAMFSDIEGKVVGLVKA